MDRGSVSFFDFPKYSLALPRPILPPKGYPVVIANIGDHIRKRRLELGLTQIEAAAQIGVTESTVWNWEHGTEPELIHMPKIIEFFSYDCVHEAGKKMINRTFCSPFSLT